MHCEYLMSAFPVIAHHRVTYIPFRFEWCIHFQACFLFIFKQVVISTDTRCMLCGCRFSHLPWTEHRLASDTAPAMRRTEQLLCLSFIEFYSQKIGCPFLPCIIWRPASSCQGIFQCTAGCNEFRVSCDQLYSIAFPRLLGSDLPTVPASLVHVTPWTVIATSNPPLELDAPIQATASPFLLLDVPVIHRQSFGNMNF